MSLVDIPGGFYYPPAMFSDAASSVGFSTPVAINGADEEIGRIFQAPQAGELAVVYFRTGTVRTGATVIVRLVTVNITTGLPNTALLDTSSTATQVLVAGTDDNKLFAITLDASATVTQGQLFAAVVRNPAASFGDFDLVEFRINRRVNFPYSVEPAGSKIRETACIAVEYASSVIHNAPDILIASAVNQRIFNNTSTPDLRGAHFQFPFDCVVRGGWLPIDPDGDYDIHLLSGADPASPDATISRDKDTHDTQAHTFVLFTFTSDFELVKDTNYRLVIEPISGLNVKIMEVDMGSGNQALRAFWPGGTNWQLTTAKTPTVEGDWTQVNTEFPYMGLWIVKVHDNDGGGGGGGIKLAGAGGGLVG